MIRFLFVVLVFSFPGMGWAYLSYAPNRNLIEEVTEHPYRVLPRSETFALALDADFFKPVFIAGGQPNYYRYDFYHGNGYWLDLRSEYRPVPELAVNLKGTFTQGTSSNGPTYEAVIFPRVGLTYRVKSFLGMNWETRLSDIDRQTVGAGLFVEMKETNGGYISASNDALLMKVMVDGTGSFALDGGLISFELQSLNGLVGGTILFQETGVDYKPPQWTGTLYSKRSWSYGPGSSLGYGLEAGMNAGSNAEMAQITYQATAWDRLKLTLKPQVRHYGKGILGSLPGQVVHNYVSYDQNDKPFTTLMNIFAYGDHVETYSTQANLEFRVNRFYSIFAENELFAFRFHDRSAVQDIFLRAGFHFYPFHEREDEFGLLVGNKYLISSTKSSPDSDARTFVSPTIPDFENKPLFMKQLYWMVHYSVKI
jgi:hypothetical protein